MLRNWWNKFKEARRRIAELSRTNQLLLASHWSIQSPGSLAEVLRNLPVLFDASAIAYLPGVMDDEVRIFTANRPAPNPITRPIGWYWPPRAFPHILVSAENMEGLAGVCDGKVPFSITNDLEVYQGESTVLFWHDIPTDPLYVGAAVPESRVASFAAKLQVTYRAEGFIPDSDR